LISTAVIEALDRSPGTWRHRLYLNPVSPQPPTTPITPSSIVQVDPLAGWQRRPVPLWWRSCIAAPMRLILDGVFQPLRAVLGLHHLLENGSALPLTWLVPRGALATEPYGGAVGCVRWRCCPKDGSLWLTTAGGTIRPCPLNHANPVRAGPICWPVWPATGLPPGGWLAAGCVLMRYPRLLAAVPGVRAR